MATRSKNDARIDFRLSKQAKATIEKAAALMGQGLSDFAVTTLLERANEVLDTKRLRVLSERDARIFLSVLDDDSQPNPALREAAEWYKENYGGSVAD